MCPSARLPEGHQDRQRGGDPQPGRTRYPGPPPRGCAGASAQMGCGRRPSAAHPRQGRSGPPRGGGEPLPGGGLSLRRGGGGLVSPLGAQSQEKRCQKGSIGCKNRPKSVPNRPSRGQKRPCGAGRVSGAGHGIPGSGNFCQAILPVLTGRLHCRPAHIRQWCSGRGWSSLSAHCLQFL